MQHIYSTLIIFCFLIIALSKLVAQNQIVGQQEFSITKVDYYAGTTSLHFQNHTHKKLKLRMNIEIHPTETEKQVEYSNTILLDSNQKTVTIHDIYYCKAIIRFEDKYGNIIMSHEVNDGAWKIENPEDLFFQELYIEDRPAAPNLKLIERSLIVVPRLYNIVYVTKNITAEIKDFDQLSFESDRLDELKIILEHESGNYEYFIEDIQDGTQNILLKNIKNEYGESCPNSNIKNIHFELKGYELAMPIKLKDIAFSKSNTQIMTKKHSDYKHKIYPNPTNGQLNIQMKNPGVYRFELFNAQQQVYLKYIEVNGNTQISLPNFTAGAYYYRISNEEEEWMEKLIVR